MGRGKGRGRGGRASVYMPEVHLYWSLASERSKRDQSCSCSIKIQISTYLNVYICGRIKLYAHAQLFITRKNKKLRGPVLCTVGGVKLRPIVTT